MAPAWTRLLQKPEEREITVRGETFCLVPLPARALLAVEAEAARETGSPFARALRGSAALTARCLQKDGKAVFDGAEAVLDALTAEEINGVAEQYRRWSRSWDASYDSTEEEIASLKKV